MQDSLRPCFALTLCGWRGRSGLFYFSHQSHSNEPLVSAESSRRTAVWVLGWGWSHHRRDHEPSVLMRSEALRRYELIVSLQLRCLVTSTWVMLVIKLHSWLAELLWAASCCCVLICEGRTCFCFGDHLTLSDILGSTAIGCYFVKQILNLLGLCWC